MQQDLDYYDILQVSQTAEPETIHRVYRLLAQRYHPDNLNSGNGDRFRALHEAYSVLSDPESRARYDVSYTERKQQRWRLVGALVHAERGAVFRERHQVDVVDGRAAARDHERAVIVRDLEQ